VLVAVVRKRELPEEKEIVTERNEGAKRERTKAGKDAERHGEERKGQSA
jgi:hypothetical protein